MIVEWCIVHNNEAFKCRDIHIAQAMQNQAPQYRGLETTKAATTVKKEHHHACRSRNEDGRDCNCEQLYTNEKRQQRQERSGNPEFINMLQRMEETHAKKAADYTATDPDENFRRAATLISWFNSDNDKTFVNHIGTKLARLATLLNSNKEPNNESVDDSFLDLANYCVLWYASWKRKQKEEKSGPEPTWE